MVLNTSFLKSPLIVLIRVLEIFDAGKKNPPAIPFSTISISFKVKTGRSVYELIMR